MFFPPFTGFTFF